MAVKTVFKNSVSEKRWAELHAEKAELQAKKKSKSNEEKLETIISLMTSCKVGFNLTEAKVKKIIKFLKSETGVDKVRYGTLPDGEPINSILYKEIVVSYVKKDDQILFKES